MGTKIFRVALLVSVLLSLTTTLSYAQDFEKGLRAYEANDYEAAIAEWRPLAREGEANAQFRLGILYQLVSALGLEERDISAEGIKWIHKAAVQGHAAAQLEMGKAYLQAKGHAQAVEWFKIAAGQGLAAAQYELGVLSRDGIGVEKDLIVAVSWFQLAAEQGYADAQNNLGIRYQLGQGVPQDLEKALFWFQSAAEEGNAPGQFNLGASYANGQGVQQDLLRAYMWITLASDDANNLGTEAWDILLQSTTLVNQWKETLGMLGGYMTQADVALAKAMAFRCLANE